MWLLQHALPEVSHAAKEGLFASEQSLCVLHASDPSGSEVPGHGGAAADRQECPYQCCSPDVDECRAIPDICRGDMRCVNQNGGYLCLPRTMYNQPFRPEVPALPEPVYPDTSVDIDECETNSHHCNPTQVCINTAGGYTCSCTEGYWLIGGQCHDIDECRYGYCQQLCANVQGSYSCSCNLGFVLNPDGRTCQDVDECEEEPCSHGCFNTYGSFMCNCDEGFELAADGTTCIDLDECSFSEFLCQNRCVNTPGSFTCICPPGYYVFEDGRSCEDLNECETGNNTCTAAQVCFNFQGSYTCLNPLQCPPPYIEVSDNGEPLCRNQPFTILYRHMDMSSGRTVPADIFQMQATTRYPGAFYIFQIKSGNEGREFYMRVNLLSGLCAPGRVSQGKQVRQRAVQKPLMRDQQARLEP
uniref:Fibulin 5 n=1 Tax=Neogobius melanostomus TaxID=47308 RepID=A0A8C6TTD1_9GOBI